MKNYNIIDFRFASIDDVYSNDYVLPFIWSRPYEYKYVTDFILNTKMENPEIHNSSWGFEGVHVMFRDELDLIGKCVHSDIVSSKYRNTVYYDITKENDELNNSFDFVLNVSTIEHLPSKEGRIKSIKNLFKQVKSGGYLILTFDYPSVELIEIEELIGVKCKDSITRLNGSNSINPNHTYSNLNIIYLILKKEKNE